MLREFRDVLRRGNLVAAMLGQSGPSGLELTAAARRRACRAAEVGAA